MSNEVRGLIGELEKHDPTGLAAQELVKIGAPAVDELCAAIRSSDHVVRFSAAESLGLIGDARAVGTLRQALGDNHYPVCRAAAVALGKIGPPAVSALCEALADAEHNNIIARLAATALGSIGEVRCIDALITALNHWTNPIHSAVIEALVTIGAPAVEALCRALGDEKRSVRWSAACTLGRIGDASAVAALCIALVDINSDVRLMAAYAIGSIRDTRGITGLCTALRDQDNRVQYTAAEALGMIGGRDELPLKILLNIEMTAPARAEAIDALHAPGTYYWSRGTDIPYRTPDALHYCRTMAMSDDSEVRDAADAVLRYLSDRTLLRPSQRDDSANADELLRAASGGQTCDTGDALLRGAMRPQSS